VKIYVTHICGTFVTAMSSSSFRTGLWIPVFIISCRGLNMCGVWTPHYYIQALIEKVALIQRGNFICAEILSLINPSLVKEMIKPKGDLSVDERWYLNKPCRSRKWRCGLDSFSSGWCTNADMYEYGDDPSDSLKDQKKKKKKTLAITFLAEGTVYACFQPLFGLL